MPANEQTWRDTKLLHKIFGVTSALMLIATIWMFAADHNREWKPIQRMANDADIRMTDWRKFQYATDENQRQHEQLEKQLDDAQRQPVGLRLLEAFKAEVRADPATANYSFDDIDVLAKVLQQTAGESVAERPRAKLIDSMRQIIRQARVREDLILGERKFKSADRDAAVATLGLLVRDNRPVEQQKTMQKKVNDLKQALDELTVSYEKAKEHRRNLDNILMQITREEDEAAEAKAVNEAELEQIKKTIVERRSTFVVWLGWIPLPGKRILELPIFDAFNSPRKIDNLWSTGNEIDYYHRKVRRFDRCTTCHQMLHKTLTGSAIEPAFEHEYLVDFRLVPVGAAEEGSAGANGATATPAATAATPVAQPNESLPQQLDRLTGIKIAAEGLLATQDATVQFVRSASPAATARATAVAEERPPVTGGEIRNGLLTGRHGLVIENMRPGLIVGDVVVAINGNPMMHPPKVSSVLVDHALAGKPFTITVRRGMPNPYTSHPRLDLFVGSLSLHKASEFACTVCHEGQGSATAFKWASHTPNTLRQRQDWTFNRGWFDNPHWMYPMYPERFAESICLKCHHDVTSLEPSERFPEPPAPTLVQGYHVIRKFGCYGCHEINGFDGKRRVGPDLRLEPNVFAAAQELKNDRGFGNLTDDQKDWVNQLIDHPDRDTVRRRLLEVLESDAQAETPVLSRDTLDKLAPLFRDIESPGQLRKAGPSLRFMGHKLDPAFIYDWIREPKHFRPNTRMPQFFGLWNHLQDSPGLVDAQQFEPLEILGIATYLQSRTQNFEYLEPPAGITEAPDTLRGRMLFQTRGCLACHTHKAFADANPYRAPDEIVQGPDLSGIGDKLVGENQRKWLYSWIRAPWRYHPRTAMPDLFLEPITHPDGKVSDPVADIVAYLLQESKTGWEQAKNSLISPSQANAKQLDRFVKDNLAETFAVHRAEQYAQKGVPEALRGELKGAEVELVVPKAQQDDPSFQLSAEQKLMYIGRKSIGKYGCYGCHDIPGFEDAKPIGTTLADWGRKDTGRLAFEHITHYVGHPHAGGSHEATTVHPASSEVPPGPGRAHPSGNGASTIGASAHPTGESPEDREYFIAELNAGHRAGFLYQKLLEPRSYDYHKTENKRYNERLRMPQFPFSADEREAVVAFVLGLIADPPSEKYIYQPTEQRRAILAGRQVLEKYNCGGCHMLTPEQWRIAFTPDKFSEQAAVKTFPFVKAHVTPAELAESEMQDRSGLRRALVRGVPAIDDLGIPLVYDDAGDPVEDETKYDPSKLELPFDLWRPAAINGHPYDVGVMPINVPTGNIERRHGGEGGFLARYLLPHVVALEKQINPAAKGSEAWGWLPPPLHGEGKKVQTDWLHDFLLNPYPIRPATFLRMPRFNMSPAEATSLVNYFAAAEGAEFPYAFQSRRQKEHLAEKEASYRQTASGKQSEGEPRNRFHDAMRIVVNNNYCVKCHLVEDFAPTGSERAKAPNLAMTYRRLRPEYLRQWIANPKSILPYTSMPVNLPYDPDAPNLGGVSQDLYHGTSIDQVDGLVDLLMNFDEYAKERNSIVALVKEYGGPPATPEATGTADQTPANAQIPTEATKPTGR